MASPRKTKEKRTKGGRAKPVSLHPLSFEDALSGLVAVEPPKERDSASEKKQD